MPCKVSFAETNLHIAPGWKVQPRGIGLDHAYALDRIGRCERGSQLIELAQIGPKPNENPALPVEFAGDQLAGDREVQPIRTRERLRAAERIGPSLAKRHRVCEHLAVTSDLHQRGADRAQPREGL